MAVLSCNRILSRMMTTFDCLYDVCVSLAFNKIFIEMESQQHRTVTFSFPETIHIYKWEHVDQYIGR